MHKTQDTGTDSKTQDTGTDSITKWRNNNDNDNRNSLSVHKQQ